MYNSRNKLMRWRDILVTYQAAQLEKGYDYPMTQIHRKILYPKYFITYRTLLRITKMGLKQIDNELEVYNQMPINPITNAIITPIKPRKVFKIDRQEAIRRMAKAV